VVARGEVQGEQLGEVAELADEDDTKGGGDHLHRGEASGLGRHLGTGSLLLVALGHEEQERGTARKATATATWMTLCGRSEMRWPATTAMPTWTTKAAEAPRKTAADASGCHHDRGRSSTCRQLGHRNEREDGGDDRQIDRYAATARSARRCVERHGRQRGPVALAEGHRIGQPLEGLG